MPFAAMTSALIGGDRPDPLFRRVYRHEVSLLVLMENPVKALWFVVFIIILQQIDNKGDLSRVVGQSVDLPGILGSDLHYRGRQCFRHCGMVLSVPLCSVMCCLVKQAIARRAQR